MNLSLLSREERRELARAIDHILGHVLLPVRKETNPQKHLYGPGVSMDPTEESVAAIEEKFTAALLDGWNAQAKKAITKAAALVQTFGGEIDENEVKLLLGLISREMGPGLVAMTQEQVTNLVGTAYLLGRRVVGAQLGVEPKLQLIDEQARQWLADHTVFWIGDYYDEQLGQTIAGAVRQLAVEQGLGREEVGRQLQAVLGDTFARSEAYWRGLAATTVDRARNFGGVQTMIEAEVETYEILPVGDERTCPVCMTMAKHTFKLEHAVKLRDAVLNAKKPEDIKTIHPWLPYDKVKDLDTEGAVKKGLALPPYHYNCRCTYIVSSFSDITVSKEPLPVSFLRKEPVPDELPPMEKLHYMGSGSYLGGAGEKHIYEDKHGQRYIFKPAQTKAGKPEPFRAYVQEAASEISKRIYDEGQFIQVKTVTDASGRLGTLQKLLPDVEGDLKKISWTTLTPEQLRQIQREHVLDWVIGNFDSHGGNFILLKDGRVLGTDKEQAFRYIADPKSWKMSLDYHPNAIYGEQEPIYNTIYRAFAKKDVDLDLQAVLPALQRLEAIPDEEYRAILRPYAEALHGKGEKAEQLLDLAVKRKHETREQFRQFFTDLLKARDPKFKGKFKFADEMTGAELTKAPLAAQVLTKEELEKLNTKALKEMAKAKKIKYFQNMTKEELVEALADPGKAERISIAVKERVRARLEAAKKKPPLPGLEAPAGADLMQDFSQVPKTPFGIAARKDGTKIEGQVINIRRIEDDGRPGFQLTLKVTSGYHAEVERAIKKLGGGQGSFVFQAGRPDTRRGVFQMGKKKIQVGRAWYLSDENATVYFAGSVPERALMGQLEIRIYDADGVRAAKKAQELLKKIGLDAAIADPSPEEEQLLRLSRLVWQHAPQEERRLPLQNRTAKQLEDLLRSKGIDPARAAKLVEKEVWPGYKTFVDEGVSEEYRGLGAEYLFAGIDPYPDLVVKIFAQDSPGLMSTMQRYLNGIVSNVGASQSSDIKTGGADSAFVRLVPQNARGKYTFRQSYKGGGYRLIIDVRELDRTDWYAYGHDNFGSVDDNHGFGRRLPAKEFISRLNKEYRPDNEVMFRRGIRKESIIGITCDSEYQRRALIDAFKAAGIQTINGKTVEQFVKVQEMV